MISRETRCSEKRSLHVQLCFGGRMASGRKKVYNYGSVFISLENCIIPADKLEKTPSALDGLPSELETDLRIVGCEYIQTAGILLKLPQVKANCFTNFSLFGVEYTGILTRFVGLRYIKVFTAFKSRFLVLFETCFEAILRFEMLVYFRFPKLFRS
jgi:hypothetical protein